MATISKNWLGRQQHDWNGADSWAAGAPTTASVTLSDTEQFTADIDLETSGYEGVVITLNLDYAGSTDDVTIKFYESTTQDGTYTGNEAAFYSYTAIGVAATEEDFSFVIRDRLHFRIGLDVTGATDSHLCDWIYYDAWNWTSA